MSQSQPKKFPNITTKKELFSMYDLPKEMIRKSINEIIKSNRNLNITKSPRCNYILPKELQEFIQIYGLPANYEM